MKTGNIKVEIINLRDFGRGGYRKIDDYSFGSGGMVLAAPPLADALVRARELRGEGGKGFVVYPSPQGALLTQGIVETLARQDHVIIVCGHYEGVDERFIEREVHLEVSVGDCVLTGGEIPAMVIVDAMARLVPGVVGNDKAVTEDSFYAGMLDHPHYTRPPNWEGLQVPDVLRSGNAEGIRSWRRTSAVRRTLRRRPDLLCQAGIGPYLAGRVYVGIMSAQEALLTSQHLRDIALLCVHYGAQRPVCIVPERDHRRSLQGSSGPSSPRLMPSLERALDWIARREKGVAPLTLLIGGPSLSGARHWLELKRLALESGKPLFFLFLEGHPFERSGLKGDFLPLIFLEKKPMPLVGKTAVLLDRFLGGR